MAATDKSLTGISGILQSSDFNRVRKKG